MVNAQVNPLLVEFKTPHTTAPFSEIKNEHFLPALKEAINTGEQEIASITESKEKPTFENTIEALERSGKMLSQIQSILFGLIGAETSDELQQIAQEATPRMVKYQNDITLNPVLFQRVKAVYEQREKLSLSAEQQTLLKNTYLDFVRQGANLWKPVRKKFRD